METPYQKFSRTRECKWKIGSVKLEGGRYARIYATNDCCDDLIHGAIQHPDGFSVAVWLYNGHHPMHSDYHIVEQTSLYEFKKLKEDLAPDGQAQYNTESRLSES